LALVELFTHQDRNLLYYQYRYNYHPIFIVTRLVQILSGLATILLVYWILAREYGAQQARFGAAVMALFPTAIAYFPNLHHDAMLPPFLVLAAYLFIKQRFWVAGIFLGLALASKNTATLLLPVLAFEICWNVWRARADGSEPYALVRQLKGFAVTAAVGLLVLLPFANPVSYAQEILTPIMRPARDLRGENVEQFSLSARLHGASAESARTSVRPEVRLVQLLLRFESDDLFFLVIAFFLFWSGRNDPLTRVCFAFLLMALPYGLIFGHDLNYRSLQYIPFLALLCGRFAPKGHYAAFVAILLGIDVLYCIDPITINYLHTQADAETFIGALQKSLSR
jgi:4-amino-4-deoxy-L-arabinose transferase-like glycosyltransferase